MSSVTLMARATGKRANSQNPGPGSYDLPGDIGSNAKITIKSRHELKSKKIDAPYHEIPTLMGSGPKYTLASRHEARDFNVTPGPDFVPPSLADETKRITLGSKYREMRDTRNETPGPSSYEIPSTIGKKGSGYTFKGRNVPKDHYQGPSPNSYSPNYGAVLPRAPSSTLHVRPKPLKGDVTPAPGDYEISRSLGGKKSSIHAKTQSRDLSSTSPSPCQYTPENPLLHNSPKFTLKGRHSIPERPFSVQYRQIPSTVGIGPKFTLASRHSLRDTSKDTPGPEYVPPPIGSGANKYTVGTRYLASRDSRQENPSPGTYDIPAAFPSKSGAFSFKGRNVPKQESIGPGAANYSPNYSSVMPKAPAFSIHIRPQTRDSSESANFVNLGSTLSGPKFTIGHREDLDCVPI